MLYALSDLHLDEGSDARLFKDERQGRALAALCARLSEEDELVLVGDTFDCTAMQPPPHGLERFFRKLDVPREPPPRRALPALLQAIAQGNPLAIEALRKVQRLTIVPGNHDALLGEPGAGAALESIGLRARIDRTPERRASGKLIVLQHGHELDPENAQPGGPGEVLTNALHQAAIPFLRHHGARANVRMNPDRLVALRPEEGAVSVLQRWLPERSFRRFFGAFLDLLADNGAIPRPVGWLARALPIERVRGAVSKADLLWEHTGSYAIELLDGLHRPPHGAPRPDVFVLGHTHVPDWGAQGPRLYVNLGTWTERALDANSPPDTSLPLLCIDAQSIELRDLSTDSVLQRFV